MAVLSVYINMCEVYCTGFYTSTADIFILMNRIVLWLQTLSWCNVYITCTSSVDCGPPGDPQRGSLESYTGTTEGSEVFYSCNPGLVPAGRMRTVCTRNGWSPNPADLRCAGVLHTWQTIFSCVRE